MALFQYGIDNRSKVQEYPEDNIVHAYYEMRRRTELFHHDWSIFISQSSECNEKKIPCPGQAEGLTLEHRPCDPH